MMKQSSGDDNMGIDHVMVEQEHYTKQEIDRSTRDKTYNARTSRGFKKMSARCLTMRERSNKCKKQALRVIGHHPVKQSPSEDEQERSHNNFDSFDNRSESDEDVAGKTKQYLDDGFRNANQLSTICERGKRAQVERKPQEDGRACITPEVDNSEPSPKKKSRKKGTAAARFGDKNGPRSKQVPVADLDLKMKMLKEMGARKKKYIGAHVTISGGIWSAVPNAVMIGARAFGMFLKNQRQWLSKPLDEEDAKIFKRLLQEYNFSPSIVVPHGSYLMNCGSPNKEILEKSRAMLLDELQRCDMLGLDYFNFHPGSTCGKISPEESIGLIAESINLALEKTKHVTAVLESMSCQGNTIGGKFAELAQIIDRVMDKSRVGVCLDTCHMFAAGYDIKSEDGYEKVLNEFDEVIGFRYLKAVHLNDSKGKLGCHRDLHANIGQGEIGVDTFRWLMNDPRFDDIPMLLETPDDDDTKWIRLLNSLIG